MYKSKEEIAAIVYGEMTFDDIKVVVEDAPTAEDMIRYHHSVGRSIRNRFGLWEVGEDADEMSHEILKLVWELVHEQAR